MANENNGFRQSQHGLDEKKNDENGNIPNSRTSSIASFNSMAKRNGDARQRMDSNSSGNLQRMSSYVEEGSIMSLELPTGRKGFMGDIGFAFGGAVYAENADSTNWTPIPILIESVTRGSIADKAGLEQGDEIIKINGVTVANAARSLPVSLIRNCEKKLRMLVRKGKGGRRAAKQAFSIDQQQEFADAFSVFDRSSKGKISIKDVPRLCKILGYNETAICLDDAICQAKDKTGEPDGEKIRWDTFLVVMRLLIKHQDVEKDAMLAYAVFDPNRHGHFNIRHLRDAFLASSLPVTPLEMAEIFRKADPNRDERVTEAEFMNLIFPFIDMY